MKRNKLTIGLFGFGCVGYGLFQVLTETPGLNASIKKICVRDKHKQRPIDDSNFTFDPLDILDDPEINVIVELIDDADAAFEIVSGSLKRNKAVVTANKKMIADHFQELLRLQELAGVPLLYEGACCASIPIIRNLEEYYDNDLLESLEGIINGSTNYILTRTATDGLSYVDALKQAQDLGYAESNPTLDTGGFDAKYKLIILLAHAFGIIAKPEEVMNIGIEQLGSLDINYAREKGLKIKLTAQAYKLPDGKVSAFVMPRFIGKESNLYNVDDVFNGVVTRSVFSDQQTFIGKGAGAFPTASAVISDISALSYQYRYEYKKLHAKQKTMLNNDIQFHVYIRCNSEKINVYNAFCSHVFESYRNDKEGYFTAEIALEKLRLLTAQDDTNLSIIFIGPGSILSDEIIQMQEEALVAI